MPDIDVTDLLFDPQIAGQTFTVVRRQQVMQQNGQPQITTTYFPKTVGSITPTGDNSLVRQEAFTTQSNTAKIMTTFRLRGASKDGLGNQYMADIVLTDDGDSFVVVTLNDWNKFGAGFMEADCTEIDFNPMIPT